MSDWICEMAPFTHIQFLNFHDLGHVKAMYSVFGPGLRALT